MKETNMDNFAQSLIGKSPYEISKAIYKYDKEKGKGAAMAALHQSQEFGEYCSQQLQTFLNNCMALRQRDAEKIDIWWKYSTNNFVLEDIQKADSKVSKGEYIRSDRYIDLEKDSTFLNFVQNIPEIQEEMKMPKIDGAEKIRIEQRQKIVDFVRFIESDKKGEEFINNNQWKKLQKKFENFPNMPTQLISKLYEGATKYNKENPKKQNVERENFWARILVYRLDDICSGIWKPQKEEVDFLEMYLKKLELNSNDLVSKTLSKLAEIEKELKLAEEDKEKIKSEKTVTKISFVQDENDDEDKDGKIEKPVNKAEINQEKIDISKQKTEAPISPNLVWKEKIYLSWKAWGNKNNKLIQKYKSQEQDSIAFKIYSDEEKIKEDEFEADITYRKENDVVVKGKNGKVPSDEVFAEIVAQAKKNGPEICFGDIKSSEFKARLLLACLNDPEIKMINPPKMSELKDIPEDLKAKLKEKLPKRPRAEEREKKSAIKSRHMKEGEKDTGKKYTDRKKSSRLPPKRYIER